MAKKVEQLSYRGLQHEFTNKNSSFFTSGSAKHIYEALSNANNTYVRVNRKETSSFDDEWIKRIEDCIPQLEDIVRNPRRITETIGNVVPVELAKKVNGDSVRHLATHTQNVKEITEDNNVIPSKILSIENDDFYAIYENRFIATLIRKLVLFIDKRYEFCREHAILKDIEELKVKSKAIIDGSLVEIETKVKVVKPADDEGVDKANAYLTRLLDIKNHLSYCYNSEFMKMMKTEKNVRNPILNTNILRKNPTYHKCFELYRYIEGYHGAGISFSVNDEYLRFDEQELKEVNNMLMVDFLSLYPKEPSKYATLKPKQYKPKILDSIDDEEFIYGPYFSGPVEYVRIDDAYRKETETPFEFYRVEDTYGQPDDYVPKKELVTKWMKTPEEVYITDKRLMNRSMRLMHNAKEALLSRKRRAALMFEKKALLIIQKRTQEQLDYYLKLDAAKHAEEEKIKKEARKRLVGIAILDKEMLDKKDRFKLNPLDPIPVPNYFDSKEENKIAVPIDLETLKPIDAPTWKDIENEPDSQLTPDEELIYDHTDFIDEYDANLKKKKKPTKKVAKAVAKKKATPKKKPVSKKKTTKTEPEKKEVAPKVVKKKTSKPTKKAATSKKTKKPVAKKEVSEETPIKEKAPKKVATSKKKETPAKEKTPKKVESPKKAVAPKKKTAPKKKPAPKKEVVAPIEEEIVSQPIIEPIQPEIVEEQPVIVNEEPQKETVVEPTVDVSSKEEPINQTENMDENPIKVKHKKKGRVKHTSKDVPYEKGAHVDRVKMKKWKRK